MLELAISDKQGLLSYLSQPDTVEFMVNTEYAMLKASLEAALQKRYSPLNIRVHMLWQFSTTIHEVDSGDKEKNLKLAMHGYSVLQTMLEKWSESKNDPDLHITEYAALDNTHKLAKIELSRYRLLHASLASNKMDILKSDVTGRTGVYSVCVEVWKCVVCVSSIDRIVFMYATPFSLHSLLQCGGS
jgi:hypothetical protein